MKETWLKLRGWLRRDAIEADLQEEMRTHIAMKASGGADPDAARRAFGNTTFLVEESRAAWGWPQPEAWLRDFRYGLRTLARRPAFAATVILTLALGIGASSTIFSLIDTVLIRPLAYPDSERLVYLNDVKLASERFRKYVSPGKLADWQRLAQSFESFGGSYVDTFTETSGATPERIPGTFVSPGFFATFAVAPLIGRTLNAEEEQFGGPSGIVISEGLWRRRFGADPAVLGRTLVLAGVSSVITGVMPASFQFPNAATDIWAPKQARPELMKIREARFYFCVGRLKRGVTLQQAEAEMNGIQRILGEQYPRTDAQWVAELTPLKEWVVGKAERPLWLLLGSAGLLLLITCANVACLLLGRVNARAAEIATRCALGAGKAAIARQLFAEGLAYAAAGSVLGMIAVTAGVAFLRRLTQVPRITELTVDGRALAVVMLVSFLAAVLFSLAPVGQTFRREMAGPIIRGGRGMVGTGQRLPGLLVSAQFALATVLLIGAGLFLRSLVMIQETALGFRVENVLTLRVSASFNEAPELAMSRHQRTLAALAAIPGVRSVAMSGGLPGANPAWATDFQIAGQTDQEGVKRFGGTRVVTADYFQTLGIPILAGETCRMETGPEQPFSALINRQLATRYFRGRDPIGHTIHEGQLNSGMKIIGVVENAREDGFGKDPEPLIYICGYLRYWPDASYLVQTAGGPAGMMKAAREAIARIEPSRVVYSLQTLEEALDATLSQNRFRTLLVSLFSALALSLAAVGLYGVMAYMVGQRTREIGIRLAMGARPVQIVSQIMLSGAALACSGAVAGIALAVVMSRLAEALLFGVKPVDWVSYVTAAAVLFGAAALACLIPGRRAAAIDPARALREQ